jgi:NTE family protein
MVHLGLYRALVEAQIPIDAVAGTSAGSLVAAGVAQRWSADEVTEAIRLHTTPKSLLDVTLPMVALSAGRRVTDALERAFGSVEIEDCWIPFRAVSTNLTTLAAEIHRTGPLWRAVRASVAIPGVFPPLVEPRGVLVDGGLVINLPVAPLRAEFSKAFVISSLAWGPEKSQSGNRPASSGVVGAIEASRRLSRRRRGAREDGLLRTLTRLTSLGAAGTAQDRGDVHIDHDASAWGPFDWKAIDAITEVGYRTTRVAVSAGYFDEARAANPLGHSARA